MGREITEKNNIFSLDLPHPVTMVNEGLQGFPIKNVIILVVTVTGWGVDPTYSLLENSLQKYVIEKNMLNMIELWCQSVHLSITKDKPFTF